MQNNVGKLSIPVAALATACIVCILRQTSQGSLPQASGADTVAIVLGDVRTLVARRMVGKADEYFHGGVTDIDCSLDHHHEHGEHEHGEHEHGEHEHGEHEHHEHEHHEHDEHGGEEHGGEKDVAHVRAPWAFITRALRLPSTERHLEGVDSREMLPWLWAACRIDSGNVNAYANAAYVLDSLYGDAEKALAALDNGIAANPGSSELEFQKGSLLLLRLKSPEKAESAFRATLAKIPADKRIRNREDIDADLMALRTLAFLGRLAHDRGDIAAARGYLEQARAINPLHTATKSLQRLIDSPTPQTPLPKN